VLRRGESDPLAEGCALGGEPESPPRTRGLLQGDFASMPTELIMRGQHGSAVQRVPLRSLLGAEKEFCAARLETGR